MTLAYDQSLSVILKVAWLLKSNWYSTGMFSGGLIAYYITHRFMLVLKTLLGFNNL